MKKKCAIPSKKGDKQRRKTWDYMNQHFEKIFGEKNQVKK